MNAMDPLVIPAILVSMLVSVALPVVLTVLVVRKAKAKFTTVLVGAGVFFVFSAVLEKLVHVVLLQLIPSTAAFLTSDPLVYSLYGGLMAGLFEETGRLLAFLFLLKKARRWVDGLGYGVGHGGMEAILIGGLGNLNNLVVAVLIATGMTKLLAGQLPAASLDAIIAQFTGTSPWLFLVSGLERAMTTPIQVALSLLVLLAVRHNAWRRIGLFALAVLVHAAIDIPAGFYQFGKLGLLPTEGIVLVVAVLSVGFIVASRRFKAFQPEAEPIAPEPMSVPPAPPAERIAPQE
jgi:uncharacterized membrane protein YhfC